MKKTLAGITTTTLLLLPSMAAFANGEHLEGSSGGHHGMYGWGGMMLGPIMMIVVLAAVVALVVVLVRWLGMGGGSTSRRTALGILEERFARGEIDREEFEDRRRVLGD